MFIHHSSIHFRHRTTHPSTYTLSFIYLYVLPPVYSLHHSQTSSWQRIETRYTLRHSSITGPLIQLLICIRSFINTYTHTEPYTKSHTSPAIHSYFYFLPYVGSSNISLLHLFSQNISHFHIFIHPIFYGFKIPSVQYFKLYLYVYLIFHTVQYLHPIFNKSNYPSFNPYKQFTSMFWREFLIYLFQSIHILSIYCRWIASVLTNKRIAVIHSYMNGIYRR